MGHHQLDPQEQTSMKCQSKCKLFVHGKYSLKYRHKFDRIQFYNISTIEAPRIKKQQMSGNTQQFKNAARFQLRKFRRHIHVYNHDITKVHISTECTLTFSGIGAFLLRSGPVFCLSFGVSSDNAQPITGQVTEVTWPVIGWAQP